MNRLLLVKVGAEQDRHLDADEVVCKIAAEFACCEVSEPIVGCNVTGVSFVEAVEDLMLEFWGVLPGVAASEIALALRRRRERQAESILDSGSRE